MVGHAPDGRLDLAERASYISSTTKDKGTDGYANVKTPLEDIEGGALRAGGAPKLLSRQNIGVLCHYACIGILLASLPATIYPFLQVYLFVEGRVALTAETLVTLPWSLKVFYGLLSDCVPIFGNRRRPYMVIGWGTCILMLWIMAFMPVERGFWAEDAHTRLRAGTKEYEDAVAAGDPSAKEKGAKYVMMMMLAAVGYQMANVCADGVVCELAQREPLEVRGTTQSAIYATRMAASVFGRLLVGFLFNGERYGGAFDFSITFPTLMMILAIAMCPMVFVSWFFITESQSPRVNFREYLGDLWNLLQSRAVYQVIFYFFFSGVFSGISWTAESPVQRILIGVTPINNILSSVLATATLAIGVAITGKYGLAWNWRKVIILTSLVIIAIDAFVTFISVWDVFRSQWFWLGVPLAVQVPNGINFVISTYVVVELAGIGNEGAMYGLLTTVSNLSSPFATTLTRIINANWDFSNKRIGEDSTELRWDITYVVLIMYASTLFSLVFLYWLPPQKAETQELKRNGGSSKLWGGVTLFYVSFALVWSIMVNIMGIYESTNCLLIAGGTGC